MLDSVCCAAYAERRGQSCAQREPPSERVAALCFYAVTLQTDPQGLSDAPQCDGTNVHHLEGA